MPYFGCLAEVNNSQQLLSRRWSSSVKLFWIIQIAKLKKEYNLNDHTGIQVAAITCTCTCTISSCSQLGNCDESQKQPCQTSRHWCSCSSQFVWVHTKLQVLELEMRYLICQYFTTHSANNQYWYRYIFFPNTYLQRSSNLFCSGIYKQHYSAYSYHFGPLAKASIKNKALTYEIFIPCATEKKKDELCKTYHIKFWQLLLNKTRYILLKTGWCSPWDQS